MSAPVNEGDVLAGKYRVETVLGQGGMGVVVAAMHLQLSERVALKFLLPSAAANAEFNSRFQREAQITAKLRNEHVARVTDIGVLENGAPYMVMEYLKGIDLRQVLRERGPLPVGDAVDYVLQAAEGVAEAHAMGFVHRDLKPSNLFVTTRRDGSHLLKVLDFGISKALVDDEESQQLTSDGSILGSVRYISPEQLRNSRHVDPRADIWSLGAILYELLSGKAPFLAESTPALCMVILSDTQATPLSAHRPDVPEFLEQIVMRCLEKDVSRRYQDVAEFAADLSTCITVPSSRLSAERIRGMITPHSSSGSFAAAAPLSLQRSSELSVSSAGVLTSTDHSRGSQITGSVPQQGRGLTLAIAGLLAIIAAAVLFIAFRSTGGDAGRTAAVQPPATGSSQALPPNGTAAAPADPLAVAGSTSAGSTPVSTGASASSASSAGAAGTPGDPNVASTSTSPAKGNSAGDRKRPGTAATSTPPSNTGTAKDPKPHVNPLEDRQ